MLLAALTLLVVPMTVTGPFDGRYALVGAPAQCAANLGDPDSATIIAADRLDRYEAHCDWGALRKAGAGIWKAKGRCSAEGFDHPGDFRFRVAGQGLTVASPDGRTTRYSRCS